MELHSGGGGRALSLQFPRRQMAMALLCKEALKLRIQNLQFSLFYTMVIWKWSKALLVPPKNNPGFILICVFQSRKQPVPLAEKQFS